MNVKIKGIDFKVVEVSSGGLCANCISGIWEEGEGPVFPLHPNCGCFMEKLEVPLNATKDEIIVLWKERQTALKDFIKTLERFEGNEKNIYLDTKGNMTIGIGKNINAKNDFLTTELRHPTGQLLSLKQKEKLYQKLTHLRDCLINTNGPFNLAVAHQKASSLFDPFRQVFITEEYAKQEAYTYMTTEIPLLNKKLRQNGIEPTQIPQPAQKSLWDLQYNLGNTKFNANNWYNLFNALKTEDYRKAAEESHRRNVQTQRNDTIRFWFNLASTERASSPHN